jgi:predicted Zn-dependent protease
MPKVDELYDEAIRQRDAGSLQQAAETLQAGLALDPNHVLTHSALAVMLQKLQQYDDAIQHAVKVTELEPSDPFSFTQLSVIYQRCGRIPEAEDAMARARMMQMAAGSAH